MLLEGAHMLCRERGPEVNLLLRHIIFHGRRLFDTQDLYLAASSSTDDLLPAASQSSKRSTTSALLPN